MADRGMGIRLFTSKDGLQHIFEEFEGDLDSEDETDGTVEIDSNTTVITSQLRHFVVQVERII
jgi:tubulin--tyrosine ligase